MPYFKKEKTNILFIHIPKTGGSSLETYFSKKYDIPLNEKSLFTDGKVKIKTDDNTVMKTSLQHIRYEEIIKHAKYFNIDFNNIKIITIVRNPYERLMSDLFFLKLINAKTEKDKTFEIIKTFISSDKHDGHSRPQYQYLKTDDCDDPFSKITILRTESLNQDMVRLGYVDFNIKHLQNKNKVDYYSFLNNNSIKLINTFYDKDFQLFGYKKI
jgi:hypothetical protein